MAVPGSGAISLNDFHTEAGGSSGSQCSLNDSDIRGLIGKGSGATMSFNEWYGASAVVWQLTLTSGSNTTKNGTSTGYSSGGSFGTFGSVSDSGVDFYSNATLFRLFHSNNGELIFSVNGQHPNSGWNTMTIASSSFSRSGMSYSQTNAGVTQWVVSTSNPFTTGATQTITFE
tara:strand:+ start:297 stop:815 length:519 start_codon:yes stop_codon:yes gene_type:complete